MKLVFNHPTYIAVRNGTFSLIIILGSLIYLFPGNAAAACPSVSNTYGSSSSSFKASAAGTYTIWTRMKAASPTSNSVWLQIDGDCFTNIGDSGVSTSNWTWVNWQNGNLASKFTKTLKAGNHTIKIVGREANVKVDKVLLTTSSACVPTGVGSNCVGSNDTPNNGGGSNQSSGNVSQQDGTTASIDLGNNQSPDTPIDTAGTVSLNLGSEVDEGGFQPIKIEVYLYGKLIASNNGSEIKLDTTKLRNGTYKLTVKAYYQSGLVKVYTQKIKVNNKIGIWKKIWYIITSPAYWINKLFLKD